MMNMPISKQQKEKKTENEWKQSKFCFDMKVGSNVLHWCIENKNEKEKKNESKLNETEWKG